MDAEIVQCKDCGTAYNPYRHWSPTGICYACWDATLIELNKHGKFVNASKYDDEQKDVEIKRLKAGVTQIFDWAKNAQFRDDWIHTSVLQNVVDKCDELLKGGA